MNKEVTAIIKEIVFRRDGNFESFVTITFGLEHGGMYIERFSLEKFIEILNISKIGCSANLISTNAQLVRTADNKLAFGRFWKL